jgi:DNA-directed RNA polymerase subunit RPC12/RpoP
MKTNEKMEKLLRGGREFIEASFLQMKLTKISADEVLDFYLVMTLAPTADGFISHCEHDRVLGRSSGYASLQPTAPSSPCPRSRHTSLLFHCSECKRDFIADYLIIGGTPLDPVCPDCARSTFVKEVKEDEQ